MFVKWSCGCKGLIIDEKSWVIEACDSDPYSGPFGLNLFERDMKDRRSQVVSREERERLTEEERDEMVMKTFEPLPYSEVRLLLIEISRLMSDGYGFRQMQSLLSHTWRPIKEGDDG